MILDNFKDFPRAGLIIGIDWGVRRIGLAVSDERQEFAFPKKIINHQSEIINFIKSERPVGIVVGLPLHGDGTDSETTAAVRKFAADLSGQIALPIAFMEENFTSAEAEEIIKNKSGKPPRRACARHPSKRGELDAVAAAIILENAIAMMKRS
ncbi:MAG: Holliday junction resolvase RuvX [Rickettsiales bacterium]|jgi:putative Holliday junction resolvase|nr:Holliday junction resolvase RuvX [Rickettsiales bacterium]